MKRSVFLGCTAASLSMLAACADRLPTSAPAPDVPSASALATFRCRAEVRAARVTCDAAAPTTSARGDVIMGGQGTYLRLRSGTPVYIEATERFQFDVTVQNLLSQAMGTADGTSVAGVTVFFQSSPTVTSGTGEIAVENADGFGIFTATQQPYFLYPEIIYPRGTSQPRTWVFTMPPTVQTFEFTLLLQTPLHDPAGPLQWKMLHGLWDDGTLTAGTAVNDTSGFAVGANGYVVRYTGHSVQRIPTRLGSALDAVWASPSGSEAVVRSGADLYHYAGNGWSKATCPAAAGDLSGSAAASVFTPGANALYLFDGVTCATFAEFPSLSPTDAWAADNSHIAVVGTRTVYTGTPTYYRKRPFIEIYDGAAWTEQPIPVVIPYPAWNYEVTPTDVVAVAGSGIFVSGMSAETSGGTLYWAFHWNGTSWTQIYSSGSASAQLRLTAGRTGEAYGLTTTSLMRCTPLACAKAAAKYGSGPMWVSPGGSWFSAGGAGIVRYEAGTASWTGYASPQGQPGGIASVSALHALDADHVYAIRDGGLSRLNGTLWSAIGGTGYYGVWARTPAAVYLAGMRKNSGTNTNEATVSLYDGVSFATTGFGAVAGRNDLLRDVHGSGETVIAVGFRSGSADQGLIARLTPGGWSLATTPDAGSLNAVWVRSATEAYAVGSKPGPGVVLRWDGSTWSATQTGTNEALLDVADVGGEMYAVGYRYVGGTAVGIVRRLEGTSWVLQKETGPNQILRSVWGSSPADVYAVGDAGTVLHFNGSAWAYVDVPTSATLNAVSGTSAANAFIGGNKLSMYGRR
jgi:hypothetical protein